MDVDLGIGQTNNKKPKNAEVVLHTRMNRKLSSVLNALLAVDTLLKSNKDQVATLPALKIAAEELTEFIVNINANLQAQSTTTGETDAKNAAFVELGDAAFEVAGAVLSFAETSGNPTLAGQVNFSRSGVTAGSGNAVSARSQGIIDIAATHLSSLAAHGVTAAKVNALKQKLQAYDALRVLPRQTKASATAAARQLDRLFPEAERLLSNRIDKLIWQFRSSDPDFYEKYQVARRVVRPSSTSAAVEAEPPAPPATKAA
jgi:hypothetical protein